MKMSPNSLIRITFLQFLTTIIYLGFVFFQTRLISGLEKNILKYSFLLVTFLLLALYILLELWENFTREYEYAVCSGKTKELAARAFAYQAAEAHRKTEDMYISYFSNEISAVLTQNLYVRLFLQKQLIMIGLSFCMLFMLARVCSMIVLFSAVFFGVLIHVLGKKLPEKQHEIQNEKAGFLERLLELHKGVHEIHINQMEDLAEQEFARANSCLERSQFRYRSLLLNIETMAVGQNMLIYILILISGGILASNGIVGIGVFVSAAELSVQILNGWSVVMDFYSIVKSSQPMKLELEQFISHEGSVLRETMPPNGEVLVEVRGLSIQYDQQEPILKDISLSIQKGRKYLLIGESGCGKSSFVECLAGHRQGVRGEVRFYTDRIAYLPQTPFLFSGTLRENLTLGRAYSTAALCEILQKVGLKLELDLMIEPEGNSLSGGEKARVALARALLMEPELLIVDEVTANLDRQLGQQIEKLLLFEYPNMALFQVSHNIYLPDQFDVTFRATGQGIYEVKL